MEQYYFPDESEELDQIKLAMQLLNSSRAGFLVDRVINPEENDSQTNLFLAAIQNLGWFGINKFTEGKTVYVVDTNYIVSEKAKLELLVKNNILIFPITTQAEVLSFFLKHTIITCTRWSFPLKSLY